MPKHAIVFRLPEDREELEVAMRAEKTENAIWKFSMWLRDEIKYGPRDYLVEGDDGKSADYKLDAKTLTVIRRQFLDFMSEVEGLET